MYLRKALLGASLGLGLCLAASAPAQVSKVGNRFSFRINFKAGGVLKYKTKVSTGTNQGRSSFDIVYPMVQTVVGVHGDVGDVVVKSGPITFNGKPIGPTNTFRMQIDRRGKMVGGQIATDSGITAFPQTPVSPGATWKASVPLSAAAFGGSSSMVTTLYRFVRMTTFHGKPVAELALTFRAGGTTTVSGKGTALILASDGNIVHSTMVMSVTLSQSPEPMSLNVEVTRA
jgi:hypothetical protein